MQTETMKVRPLFQQIASLIDRFLQGKVELMGVAQWLDSQSRLVRPGQYDVAELDAMVELRALSHQPVNIYHWAAFRDRLQATVVMSDVTVRSVR